MHWDLVATVKLWLVGGVEEGGGEKERAEQHVLFPPAPI